MIINVNTNVDNSCFVIISVNANADNSAKLDNMHIHKFSQYSI